MQGGGASVIAGAIRAPGTVVIENEAGVLFTPIPRERQASAVRFLNEHAFQTPTWAINRDILRRIEPVGVLDRVRTGQLRVLNSLLSSPRLGRLVEQEAIDGTAAYRPLELLADVRKGIWSEVYGTARFVPITVGIRF